MVVHVLVDVILCLGAVNRAFAETLSGGAVMKQDPTEYSPRTEANGIVHYLLDLVSRVCAEFRLPQCAQSLMCSALRMFQKFSAFRVLQV